MGLEIDRRRLEEAAAECAPGSGYHVVRSRNGFELAADEVPARRINPYTATLGYSDTAEAGGSSASLRERAVTHVRSLLAELDPENGVRVELAADPQVVTTCSGERIVHLQQHVHGVPVFRAVRTVRFDAAGELLDVVGDHVPCRSDEVDLVATIDAAEAVMRAARHLASPPEGEGIAGLKVSARRPRVLGAFPLPGSPTLVHKPPFASPVRVHQILFFDKPRLRLTWSIPLWLPELFEQYDVLVAANGEDGGEIFFCRSGVGSTFQAQATFVDPDTVAPALVELPVPILELPGFAPRPLPGPWVSGKVTSGNNVEAFAGFQEIASSKVGGARHFAPANPLDAAAVNAFVVTNYLHDFFYLLGFDEAAGALQHEGPANAGWHRDRLQVTAVEDSFPGFAEVLTEPDGVSVKMNLGQVRSPNDGLVRHTGFDAHVLIHEYAHAVVARRVGPGALWRPLLGGSEQARAMEEGFGDYFGLTLGNFLRRRSGQPETLAYGGWVVGDPTNGQRSYDPFPQRFEDLPNLANDHQRGQLWCAALLGVHRHFQRVLGTVERAELAGWLLVFAALPAIGIAQDGPSFLTGRDALLNVVDGWRTSVPAVAAGTLGTASEMADLEPAVRRAFAELGMGREAQSTGGTLVGIRNDFSV